MASAGPRPWKIRTGAGTDLEAGELSRQTHTDGTDLSRIAKEFQMLGWAVTFLIIAIIAGVLGFGGIAGTSAGIAQILFFVFLVLFVVSLVRGAVRR